MPRLKSWQLTKVICLGSLLLASYSIVLLSLLVFIVDTEDGAAEGEHFAESGEHRSVDFAHRRNKEGGENQYGSKRSHTDSQDDLQGAAHDEYPIFNI